MGSTAALQGAAVARSAVTGHPGTRAAHHHQIAHSSGTHQHAASARHGTARTPEGPDKAGLARLSSALQEISASRQALQQGLEARLQLIATRKAALEQASSRVAHNTEALARLTRQQKRIEAQLARLQRRHQVTETRRAALLENTAALQQERLQVTRQEISLLPLTEQLTDHPGLILLPPAAPDRPAAEQAADRPVQVQALLPSLLALRLAVNAQRETRLSARTDRLETQEEALARASQQLEASRLDQERGRQLGLTLTQQAQQEARQATTEMEAARQKLIEARKNAQALTDEIEVLVRREAEQQARLQAEARRLARAHQAAAAHRADRAAQALSGAGLARGGGRAPVQGVLATRWGESTEGGPATGITWRTSSQVPVISPCSGHLLYAGAFRSFGNMVILDCGRGTRFVLAGFGAITSPAGASLTRGTPIGRMPAGPGALFVQLRQGSRAVNPAPYLR
ncbi:murein hydrolase activator EnvC family protein [Oecophyllibacter saccharovorans]|uniref:murein hydrolase activator EnvC family protein n=1 Tax=Oecophyllibacter saccharovorans TaxID=2558360 RepID=UPI00116DF772|nr:peptidoglycan DD-metalloendopeptidase family protein [Oecophyllibacter saccharovorans]TPW34968.1 hypothetical protein E3203_05585 [Oecophyllibacter saccharovorans]